jgi:nucleoside-diphosphate-sugar epimerase
MEWHARWFNGNQEPALTVYGVGTLAMDFSMDISKAQNLLGYTPRQSVDEALDEFIEWHLQTSP